MPPESVEVALTWVKAHAYDLGLTNSRDDDLTKNKSIHVHCPAGSDPKVIKLFPPPLAPKHNGPPVRKKKIGE